MQLFRPLGVVRQKRRKERVVARLFVANWPPVQNLQEWHISLHTWRCLRHKLVINNNLSEYARDLKSDIKTAVLTIMLKTKLLSISADWLMITRLAPFSAPFRPRNNMPEHHTILGGITRTEHAEKTGEEIEREIPYMKGYTVFNVGPDWRPPGKLLCKGCSHARSHSEHRSCGDVTRRNGATKGSVRLSVRADNLASPVKEQIRNSRCIVPASYSGVSPQHVGRVSCALQLGAHPFHELAHGRNGDRVRILRCSLCTYQWREICESPVNNRITSGSQATRVLDAGASGLPLLATPTTTDKNNRRAQRVRQDCGHARIAWAAQNRPVMTNDTGSLSPGFGGLPKSPIGVLRSGGTAESSRVPTW